MKTNQNSEYGKPYWLALTLILIGIYDILLAKSIFPPTEGWWETYAWLISTGEQLYKDVWFPFPPLHILYVRVQMDLIGHDFENLRLIGVVTHAVSVTFIYLWLSRIWSGKLSCIATVLCAVFMMTFNSAYIAKDYHTTVELFEAFALYMSTFVIGDRADKSNSLAIILCGFACGALVLTKQNIGVFFTIGMIAALLSNEIHKSPNNRVYRVLATVGLFTAGLLVLPIIVSVYMGTGWLNTYIGNRSKGSVSTVLFRFVTNYDSRKIIGVSFAIYFLIFGWQHIIKKLLRIESFDLFCKENLSIYRRLKWVLVAGILFYFFKYNVIYILASLTISWLMYIAVHERFKENWISYGWIVLASLIYCGTHTAGYNSVSMQLVFASFFCYTFSLLDKKLTIKTSIIVVTLMLIVALSFFYKSARPQYNWWGLKDGSPSSNKVQLPQKELKGFYVDESSNKFYSSIRDFGSKLKKDDTVLFYPSIPIGYMLLDIKPPVKMPVMWFDVSDYMNAPQVIKDLEKKQPKYIFWLRPGAPVYEGHLQLQRLPSLMSSIDEWILNEIKDGKYSVVDYSDFDALQKDKYEPYFQETVEAVGLNKGILCDDIGKIPYVISHACHNNKRVATISFENKKSMINGMKNIGIPLLNSGYDYIVLEKTY